MQKGDAVLELMMTAGVSLALAFTPGAGQAAGFQRHTPQVATDGVKPRPDRQGRVSKESLSIAACRARAARQGEATFKEMRLTGRSTYLVTGTIARRRGHLTYRCTVRGEGEILSFKTSAR